MKYILTLFLVPLQLFAQLPDSTIKKIDEIFKNYNSKTPGCAVAITRNGDVILQKGYGTANLEYNIPITPQTIFHIASVSKQYVAFCMLLLEKEGKLSLDDDIRKHLDYLPDFGYKITIRQLIWHTSGLRDQWQLLANAGWQLDDVIKQEHVVKIVSAQKDLNFKPGEEWMYCNTGYTLMAEIVKKVSGLTLRQYTEQNIFKPLGMNDSHFNDNYEELVPGRAYSYTPQSGSTFKSAVLSYSTYGATSLLTTVLDEAKWLNNFKTGTVGGKDLVEKMYQTGVLNDGRKLDYAFGIGIGEYKGHKTVSHSGGDAGFVTFVCMFPEDGINIIVFSNHGYTDPGGLTFKIADLLMPEIKKKTEAAVKHNADSLLQKKMVGSYYSERGDFFKIVWQNGKLYRENPTKEEIFLDPIGNNLYAGSAGVKIRIDPANKASDSVGKFDAVYNNRTLTFQRLKPQGSVNLAQYAGRYYCPETEGFYTVIEKDGKLQMTHRKFNTVPLNYFAPDQFKLGY